MENEDNPIHNEAVDDSSDSEEEVRHPLEDRLVSMFPFTPRGYIRNKLANIKDTPEAFARLTEELLRNPTPKNADWNDDKDGDEEQVEEWKEMKLIEMRSLFPDRCPDWLMGNLTDIAVFSRSVVGNENIQIHEILTCHVTYVNVAHTWQIGRSAYLTC